MKKLLMIVILSIINISYAGNNQSPIKVEVYDKTDPLFGVSFLEVKVLSVDDKIVINDIVANRGKCRLLNKNRRSEMPRTLGYGDAYTIRFASCNLLEISVNTNKGNWTVSY